MLILLILWAQHILWKFSQDIWFFQKPNEYANKQKFCFLWDSVGGVACQDDMRQLHYFLKSCYDSSVVSPHIAVIFCHISQCDQLFADKWQALSFFSLTGIILLC